MKPKQEAAALQAIDTTITQLTRLRPLMISAFARDDEPQAPEDHSPDPVHKVVKGLVEKVLDAEVATTSWLKIAQELERPQVEQMTRQLEAAPCLCCGAITKLYLRRGLCDDCYEPYRYSGFGDFAVFKRDHQAKHKEPTTESQAA